MAVKYIKASVNISYRYCTSLKNTKSADNIKPVPTISTNRHIIGKITNMNFQVMVIRYATTNMKKITNVKRKLIDAAIIFEIKKRYLGAFTFVIIPAFDVIDCIPLSVASLK
jgi:hypothetical protein